MGKSQQPDYSAVLVTDWGSGILFMLGFIHPYVSQQQLNSFETNGLTDIIVKNSTGSIVAVFDSNGNIFLRQYVKQIGLYT